MTGAYLVAKVDRVHVLGRLISVSMACVFWSSSFSREQIRCSFAKDNGAFRKYRLGGSNDKFAERAPESGCDNLQQGIIAAATIVNVEGRLE